MKTIWSGSLSFGLVMIPIRLYSAIQSHTLGFRLLHRTCNTPLEFHRWCPRCESIEPDKKGIKAFLVLQESLRAPGKKEQPAYAKAKK